MDATKWRESIFLSGRTQNSKEFNFLHQNHVVVWLRNVPHKLMCLTHVLDTFSRWWCYWLWSLLKVEPCWREYATGGRLWGLGVGPTPLCVSPSTSWPDSHAFCTWVDCILLELSAKINPLSSNLLFVMASWHNKRKEMNTDAHTYTYPYIHTHTHTHSINTILVNLQWHFFMEHVKTYFSSNGKK